MRILVITEDSAIQLPKMNRWTNKVTAGQNIENESDLIKLLNAHNLPTPKDDLANEERYKNILKSYVRPAKYMFSGIFSEVRDFSKILATFAPTDLYIVSGRYGLINENESIVPYSKNVKTTPELQNIDNRLGFTEKILALSRKYSLIILLLPNDYIQFFITKGLFESIPKNLSVVIVTGTQNGDILSRYPQFTVLPRKGVARLGHNNQNKIIEKITNWKLLDNLCDK